MSRVRPEDCRTMAELRAQIDGLDRELVALLAHRSAYIDRAAELKVGEGMPARIEARILEVIGHVRRRAAETGLSPDLVEAVWQVLIEWSVQREERVLGPDPGTVRRTG